MNKLEMAHDWFMKHAYQTTHEKALAKAWQYADAMQAEADKREDKTRPAVLQEEWQPDWSQAPAHDVVAWDIDERGQARWIASDNGYYLAPEFGYTGRWQDSLRKRPE